MTINMSIFMGLVLILSAGKLPDTGQTNSYTDTFGEDSDYTIHAPVYIDNGNGTISDSITKLIWQKGDGGEMTWEDAIVYADSLTLGLHDDWRLPTPGEAFNILNLDRLNPALDTDYFIISDAEYWWTSAQRADDPERIWVTNTGGGIGPHPKTETISAGGSKRYHVRCVRGDQSVSKFINNNDGTVSDSSTGLLWQQTEPGIMSWEAALTYCEQLELGEYDDWRLPNIKELRTICDEGYINPSINTNYFPGAMANRYWSSTTEINGPSRAWFVNLKYGLTSYEEKTIQLNVRAVRGGIKRATRVDVEPVDLIHSHTFQIHPVYPNPFNSSTNISYQLIKAQQVSISVFSIDGKKIADLINQIQSQGEYQLKWDTGGLPTGTYIIRFQVGSNSEIRKCILMK